jgi:hypothetical protein
MKEAARREREYSVPKGRKSDMEKRKKKESSQTKREKGGGAQQSSSCQVLCLIPTRI